MRTVFIGPSGSGLDGPSAFRDLDLRGPARMGDVAEAVLDGASVIGLVDGTFVDHAAVWHKEILFALSQGVRVFGAASMGALRAAECAAFGMVGIGRVFEALMRGDLVDDAAVALAHAPAELGSKALSVALVDAEATCDRLVAQGLVTVGEDTRLRRAARALFFADRTHSAMAAAFVTDPARRTEIARLLDVHRQDIKARDARLLIRHVRDAPDERLDRRPDWPFVETLAWRRLLESVRQRRTGSRSGSSL